MRRLPPSSGSAERVRARAACLDSFRIVRERRVERAPLLSGRSSRHGA
jgi:hypothetical protein